MRLVRQPGVATSHSPLVPVALRQDSGEVVAAGLSRRGALFLAATWAFALAYVAIIATRLGAGDQAWEEHVYIPLALAAAAGAWVASTRRGACRNDRIAWQLLTAAWLCVAVGEVFWQAHPVPVAFGLSAAELLDGGVGRVLAIAAFALFIHKPRGRYAKVKLVTEVALAGVVMATLAWYYQYAGVFGGTPHGAPSALVTWGEIAMMGLLTVVLHRPLSLGGGGALQLLAVSKFASTVGSLLLEQAEIGDAINARQASAIIFAVSAAGYTSAGVLFACFDRRRGNATEWQRDVRVLPYILLASLGMVLLIESLEPQPDGEIVSRFVIAGLLTTALLMLRMIIAGGQLAAMARDREAQSRRLTTLVRRSHEAVLTVDAQRTITFASPAAELLLAGAPMDLVGRPLLDYVQEGDQADITETLAAPVDGALRAWRCGRGDRWRDVESLVTDLRDEPGVNGVVLHCRDVTERRRMEREQRQTQKLEAIGLLAGGIAHDFNNLLTVIRANSELLRAEHPEAGTLEVDEIEQAAERGASLCRQLLAFSRSDAPQREAQDLGGLVGDVEPMLRRVLPRAVQLVIHAEPGAVFAQVDTVQLDVVLLNLVSNSRDALPDGGVVTIDLDRHEVKAGDDYGQRAVPPGDYARLIVRDDGEGMTEDALSHAFEPFFTTKPHGKGTGLGLATVHGVITSHGGFVRVESERGKGTAVTVLLPFEARAAQRKRHATPVPVDAGRHGRILVVEDEDAIRALVVRYLARAGYDLIEASDGVEALDLLSQELFKVDLVLSDMTMPRMNGGTLVRRVRNEHPEIAIVVMSGYSREDGGQQAAPPADVAHITKPFALGELGRVVRETMERKKQGAAT